MKSKSMKFLVGILLLVIITVAVYWIPPVHSRLSWRLESVMTRIKYTFNPPDESIFLPSPMTQTSLPVAASETPTMTALNSTTPVLPVVTSTTPTISPTPLPDFISLPNVVYVDQFNRWNYCGPANLTMALNYWGWKGTRDDVAAVVKPGIQDMSLDFIQQGRSDKNVIPYELTDYVQEFTNFNVVLRYGGDIDLLKRLVAAGFPVVTEKGYYEEDYTGKVGWLGHYQFVTGYEDGVQSLIVQDTYNDGPNFRIPFDKFTEGWRSFDFVFFIVYPPEREFEVFRILDQWPDPNWRYQHALDMAESDIKTLTGMDLYFAWFNKGTSLVKMGQYAEASQAYDQAFLQYSKLSTDNKRPWRMMWYQTGPYMAYYYSGRYGDVINLADLTLKNAGTPTLEESLYWRGMAEIDLGQTLAGIDDLCESVRLNPNFTAGLRALANLGIT